MSVPLKLQIFRVFPKFKTSGSLLLNIASVVGSIFISGDKYRYANLLVRMFSWLKDERKMVSNYHIGFSGRYVLQLKKWGSHENLSNFDEINGFANLKLN